MKLLIEGTVTYNIYAEMEVPDGEEWDPMNVLDAILDESEELLCHEKEIEDLDIEITQEGGETITLGNEDD